MAVCRACDRDFGKSASCDAGKWKGLAPVPYGSEAGIREHLLDKGLAIKDRCRDCGVAIGGFHHALCCVEECPKCHGQAWGCSCLVDSLPASVDRFGPFADDYSQSDVVQLAGTKAHQIENWTRNGWLMPGSGLTGRGHHRRFSFPDLVDASVGAALSWFHVPFPALFRDVRVKTLRELLPDFWSNFLSLSDEEIVRDHVRGARTDPPAAQVAEYNAHLEPGEKRMTEKAWRKGRSRSLGAWRADAEQVYRSWLLIRNPATRPAGAYLSLLITPDEGRHTFGHFTKPGEGLADASLVINLVKILENLERATGDHWRDSDGR